MTSRLENKCQPGHTDIGPGWPIRCLQYPFVAGRFLAVHKATSRLRDEERRSREQLRVRLAHGKDQGASRDPMRCYRVIGEPTPKEGARDYESEAAEASRVDL
jgi:hypothetical protein